MIIYNLNYVIKLYAQLKRVITQIPQVAIFSFIYIGHLTELTGDDNQLK